MIQLSDNINVNGLTFSSVNPNIYKEYDDNKDGEVFEKVVFDLMLNKYSEDKELTEYVLSLPKEQQRMAVLSLIDDDNNLWTKMNTFVDECNDELEHIKDVIKIMFKFVKEGEVEKKKFGEVMTPLDLVKDILKKLPNDVWSNPNLKWLDPANGAGTFPLVVIYKLMKGLSSWEPNIEKRYKHIVENMIYTCELQSRNVFLWLCGVDPKDKYTTNTYWGSFLDSEFDNHMKSVWGVEKFDIVIGNPPYNNMIDIDFLTKSYSLSDVVLFVHPSTWLLDEKGKQRKFINAKELVAEHLESIELFNGNKMFNIVLSVPCCITLVNKNKSIDGISCVDVINKVNIIYNDINQINKFSNIDIYPKLKNKIINKTVENLQNILKKDKGSNFYVNLSQITGNVHTITDSNMVKDDFYTLCGRNISVSDTPREQREKTQASFLTENEANNFINYVKTDFVRFCLSMMKINKNVYCGEMSLIPWLDFTREWSDKDLIDKFELSDVEVDFIKKNIPKFY